MGTSKVLGAVLGASWAAMVSFSAADAAAQTPPAGVAIGIERAFGIANTSETTEQGDVSTTTSVTDVSLGVGYPVAGPSLARVGVDYLMDGGLSVGAGLGVASISMESETEIAGASASGAGPTFTALVFAPRVGYALMLTDALALWPRGGITYASLGIESEGTDPITGAETTNESSESDLFLTVEVPLWVLPAPNFGFLVAPTLDYSLSHTAETNGDESDADVSVMAFGLRFGVVGVL